MKSLKEPLLSPILGVGLAEKGRVGNWRPVGESWCRSWKHVVLRLLSLLVLVCLVAFFAVSYCIRGYSHHVTLASVLIGQPTDALSNNGEVAGIHSTFRNSQAQAEAEDFARRNWKPPKRLKNMAKSFRRRNLSWDSIWSGDPSYRFDIRGNDVIVFLHIQKTGGTMIERFLTRHIKLERPCECMPGKKKCKCYRPTGNKPFMSDHQDPGDLNGDYYLNLDADWRRAADVADESAGQLNDVSDGVPAELDRKKSGKSLWLFSRFSTGWSCGLHADWTELVTTNCVDNVLNQREHAMRKRRYFYMTFLRDPIRRFISEFRHVQRGGTWLGSLHLCNDRLATPAELPMCFDPEKGWFDVTIDEFLACPYNLAFNRQTRMLADLTLVGCYNTSLMSSAERNLIMLNSAKRNLKSMSYFGILEDLPKSQRLFEATFDLYFRKRMRHQTTSKSADTVVSASQMQRIKQLNQLDMKLYQYAKELFQQRYHQAAKITVSPQPKMV